MTVSRLMVSLTGALVALPAPGWELEQLSFMAGHWIGAGGEPYEEVWLEPGGGTMPGSFRWVFADGRQVLEYLVIAEAGEDVFLRFKHFDGDYVPWEQGEPNVYRLTGVQGTSATFARVSDNADVPKTLIYTREGDSLSFRGLGDDATEQPLLLDFTLHRPAPRLAAPAAGP